MEVIPILASYRVALAQLSPSSSSCIDLSNFQTSATTPHHFFRFAICLHLLEPPTSLLNYAATAYRPLLFTRTGSLEKYQFTIWHCTK